MKTDVYTPHTLFGLAQQMVVPLFQRRYVWEAEEQWHPLWEDIVRTTGRRREGRDVSHFLGAAVLQANLVRVGQIPQWSVIDGQQRLTTLQLAFDAVAAVLEDGGHARSASRLERLTHNDDRDIDDDEALLKLRHQNDDGPVYREVMTAEPPVAHEDLTDPTARLTRAHAFFTERARAYMGAGGDADALVETLQHGLQMVVISLQADEDSQEIFETLNARGTPLTAADLIKNFLLQRIQAERGDADRAYHQDWRPFEAPFWEAEVNAGRTVVSRATLFLQQWLIARLGEEVAQSRLFPMFKDYVLHRTDAPAAQVLAELAVEARTYRKWIEQAASQEPNLGPVALSLYRYSQTDTQVALPLLIWLHDPRHGVPADEVRRGVLAVESWVMRRMLLRLTTADLGRTVASLISRLERTPVHEVGAQVEQFLSGQNRSSTFWPGDDTLRRELGELPAYQAFRQGRLRMVLEAVEDDRRGFTSTGGASSAGRVARQAMHIEHVLPQRWKSNWPVAEGDLAAEVRRDEHVHRWGNLTLLTQKLNGKLSNQPWSGERGKQQVLESQDDNLLTRDFRRAATWGEEQIDERSKRMVESIPRTWPVPEGHTGAVVDREPPATRQVALRDLVASGDLEPGTVLRGKSRDVTAEVTDTGQLRVGDLPYDAPSGAGYAATGKGMNGWRFWLLPDGRSLHDVRTQLRARESGVVR